MTLSDLEKRITRGHILFRRISVITLVPFNLEPLARGNMWKTGVFLRRRRRPSLRVVSQCPTPPKNGDHTNAKTVWFRVTKFPNTCGEKHANSRRSSTPLFQREGPLVRKFYGISYMRAHSIRNSDQTMLVDQTRCEKNIAGSTTPMPWP